jgi:endoglucanase
MKPVHIYKYILILFLFANVIVSQQNKFNRGVNITNWFQSSSAKQIQFSKFDKHDFEQLKSIGVDVVRLPINLHAMTSGSPNYTLDTLFLYFLDQAADWAEELDINLILDNHTFDVTANTPTDIDQVLIPVWTQMAEHFKNRSNKIFYEVLNEPHGITDIRWNEIQQSVVAAIRKVDQRHTIVVGPAGWNSYNNLYLMPVYSDTNLIYTFHFYDPFIFTHQGASWASPSLVPLGGVPFPYDASRMPTCPAELKGTWVESELASGYKNSGTAANIKRLISAALNFKNSRNVSMFCGEFGVYIPNSPNDDRILWYETVRKILEENNIAWTTWDYKGGFGLFEKDSNELFDYDLNTKLLSALGFNITPQSEYVKKPDSTGFSFYTDYIMKNVYDASGTGTATIDFYSNENPHTGNFCLYWTGASQYNNIAFDFSPDRDLSYLKNNSYDLDMWVKGDNANIKFDIRFVDTKTDSTDHPWRMRYTIDKSKVNFNNEWQHLQIPLNSFSEYGSWDNNAWYNPQGLFDWSDVDRFEIVAEHQNMGTAKLWFDEIKISNPDIIYVEENVKVPAELSIAQNYPNPFNPVTTINFSLPKSGFVTVKIYDSIGREIKTLVNEEKFAGNYSVQFDGSKLSSGVYFYRIVSGSFSQGKKCLLMK